VVKNQTSKIMNNNLKEDSKAYLRTLMQLTNSSHKNNPIMEGYICKECGADATVDENGVIIRTCEHNTTVILNLEVVVTGESSLE
jgi:hypothetical protein